jgi:hypothetical protein
MLAVVLAGLLACGGCASAGLMAASPLVTAVQLIADRSVERTVPADLGTAGLAAAEALSRMGIRVLQSERRAGDWTLRGAGEAVTTRVELARVTGGMTRLSVTVEAGRVLADKETATEILNQIAIALADSRPAARPAPLVTDSVAADALAALRGEITRLRSDLDTSRAAATAPALPRGPVSPAPTPVLSGGGVFTVPEAYGLPTPTLGRAESRPPTGTASRPTEEHLPSPLETEGDVLAGALQPARALTPVPPMSRRSPE